MKAQTARQLRKVHHYVGLFFAPAILFFAFSGALQTLGLHENHGARPPAPTWIQWLASVHKDQRLLRVAPPKGPPPAIGDKDDDHGPSPQEDAGPSPILLKAFVLLLSLGLIVSSILGMTIAVTNRASRKQSIVTLVLGGLVPVVLLFV